MLIAHEAPISVLNQVAYQTDYQYALVHLFEHHPEYYNFFKAQIASGHEVLLDNSIFELKVAFDPEKYANYIRELKPTYFILPDVLEDSFATMNSFDDFNNRYCRGVSNPLPGLRIGAVQGKTYQDISECYRFMSEHADYIAISFDFSFYQTIGIAHDEPYITPELAKLERMCTGRQKLIKMLMDDGLWNHNKPHHLLGCSLPKEFTAYRNIPSIRSVDTSNPVMAGINNTPYIIGIGLTKGKPKGLLADNIKATLSPAQIQTIHRNIMEFRMICNGQ